MLWASSFLPQRGESGGRRGGDREKEAEKRDEAGGREKGLGEEAAGEREGAGGMGKARVKPGGGRCFPSDPFPSPEPDLLLVAPNPRRGGAAWGAEGAGSPPHQPTRPFNCVLFIEKGSASPFQALNSDFQISPFSVT